MKTTQTTYASRRTGFTLVELLVVITIIGILAGLTLVAVNGVMTGTRNAAMKLELMQIGMALDQYKEQRGSLPPDGSLLIPLGNPDARINAVNQHLNRMFTNRNQPVDNAGLTDPATVQRMIEMGIVSSNAASGLSLATLDPSEMYVLFLMGFSPDVERPLTGPGERTRLFDFDQTRLIDDDGDGWWSYKTRYSDSEIAYFNSNTYANTSTGQVASWDFGSGASRASGIARPYALIQGTTPRFCNPTTFQLICAGEDAHFGGGFTAANEVKHYPSGIAQGTVGAVEFIGYTEEDRDNVTNFIEGSSLEADEALAE